MQPVVQAVESVLRERGMTRLTLAELSGVGIGVLHRWWNEGAEPKWRDVLAVAAALDLPLDYLRTGDPAYLETSDPATRRIIDFVLSLPREDRIAVYGAIRYRYGGVNRMSTHESN